MKKLLFLLLPLFLILFSACSEEDDVDISIQGKVTDSSGNPVENAYIQLTYNTEAPVGRPLTPISFAIPASGHVKLWITRYESPEDTVKILADEELESGNHSISWDGTNSQGQKVVSHIYNTHVQIDNGDIQTSSIFLHKFFYTTVDTLENYECYAKTDQNGEFKIPQKGLPFGYIWDDNEDPISRYVKIWAMHNSYDTISSELIYIEPDISNHIDLQFH